MTVYRRILAVVCAVLCLALTGCSAIGLTVESQLTPPKNSGEQEAIRSALDAYITSHTKNGESAEYTLKYPANGNYLTAFIMLDQVRPHTLLAAGDATSPTAAYQMQDMGLAFYRRNHEGALVHINLLKRAEDGTWSSVADVAGNGESVRQVEFADLDNNGVPELLIGWKMYNSRDSRLAIYDMDNKLAHRSFSGTYTDLVVADLTADGADDLLLLSLMAGESVTSAQMFSFQSDNVITSGHTLLDGDIIGFGGHTATVLTPNVNGVFVDCYKDQGAMITELICWKGGELTAPLCDADSLLNTVTAREAALESRDIDGDGVVEWPFTMRMAGFEETDSAKTLWHTEWRCWDEATETVRTKFHSLIPAEDGYTLRLRPEWEGLPAAYDAASHTLTLYEDEESGAWLFRLRTFSAEESAALPAGYVLLEETDNRRYAVCPANTEAGNAITLEEIRYLFTLLSEEEGADETDSAVRG